MMKRITEMTIKKRFWRKSEKTEQKEKKRHKNKK
jgi:hypothetical protein